MNRRYIINQKGQSLVEYLILVCLVSVSAIAIVSVVGQNIKARFATISSALRGDSEIKKELESPQPETYQIRGFGDYDESAKAKNNSWQKP